MLTLLGFLNPLGPVGVIGSMAMATTKAHRDKPIWVTEGGAELPVTNIAAATALIGGGPGKYSLDRAFGLRLPGWLAPLGLGPSSSPSSTPASTPPNRPTRTRPARAPRATTKRTRKGNSSPNQAPCRAARGLLFLGQPVRSRRRNVARGTGQGE